MQILGLSGFPEVDLRERCAKAAEVLSDFLLKGDVNIEKMREALILQLELHLGIGRMLLGMRLPFWWRSRFQIELGLFPSYRYWDINLSNRKTNLYMLHISLYLIDTEPQKVYVLKPTSPPPSPSQPSPPSHYHSHHLHTYNSTSCPQLTPKTDLADSLVGG